MRGDYEFESLISLNSLSLCVIRVRRIPIVDLVLQREYQLWVSCCSENTECGSRAVAKIPKVGLVL